MQCPTIQRITLQCWILLVSFECIPTFLGTREQWVKSYGTREHATVVGSAGTYKCWCWWWRKVISTYVKQEANKENCGNMGTRGNFERKQGFPWEILSFVSDEKNSGRTSELLKVSICLIWPAPITVLSKIKVQLLLINDKHKDQKDWRLWWNNAPDWSATNSK